MTSPRSQGQSRPTAFECLESRIVFNVDPVLADLLIQGELDSAAATQVVAYEAIESTDAASYVLGEYQFDGRGQTVAVIDSGIAWDHYALGGGFGPDFRVVGGWDFAEGDANPFDDGSAGYHGTHVAGIIGSTDDQFPGLAPGVDLVSLRVFDDNGSGELAWVEQALQWVHDHQYEFENPITTVNLSLGVDWDSESSPALAILEDELAQLKADNIFVAVAAGNGFESQLTTGLAYPAASEHVVAVASHDANGLLSDFSQRIDQILAAPGDAIRSTVPGHLSGTGPSSEFLAASGTSMAAPYVAGASVILREAMQFMGYQDIDQDRLLDHFHATADHAFDSLTGSVYHRINLTAAIDAIIPDAHGDTLQDATTVYFEQGQAIISGLVGKVSDIDTFTFVADQSGDLTLTLEQTDRLQAALDLNGDALTLNGNRATLQIQQGQTYHLSVKTTAGIGRYHIGMQLENQSTSPISIVDGRLLIQGTEAAESFSISHGNIPGQISVQVGQILQSFQTSDFHHVQIAGSGGLDSLRLELHGHSDAVYLFGDESFVQTSQFTLASSGFESTQVIGDQSDKAVFLDSIGIDQFLATTEQASMIGAGYDNRVTGVNDILAASRFGEDVAQLQGADGDDRFIVTNQQSRLDATGRSVRANGFSHVQVAGNHGIDSLVIHGSSQIDQVLLSGDKSQAALADASLVAVDMEEQQFVGQGTADHVLVQGTNGNDVLYSTDSVSILTDGHYQNTVLNVSTVEVNVADSGGMDTARILDSRLDDQVTGNHYQTRIESAENQRSFYGFDSITISAVHGGHDIATFTGTRGADTLYVSANSAWVWGATYHVGLTGFDQLRIDGHGGADHAVMNGDQGNNNFIVRSDGTSMLGNGYEVVATQFQHQKLNGSGGQNVIQLQELDEDDMIEASESALLAWLHDMNLQAENFIWLEAETREGHTSNQEIGAVDFWYTLHGNWNP